MFDSHTYVKMVTHQSTVNNVSFQQVSGSLIKTHPDSIFLRFDKTSQMEDKVFDAHPTLRVKVGKYSYDNSDKFEDREVTVLQVLLAHDKSYVCEVVIHYQKGDCYYTEEKE